MSTHVLAAIVIFYYLYNVLYHVFPKPTLPFLGAHKSYFQNVKGPPSSCIHLLIHLLSTYYGTVSMRKSETIKLKDACAWSPTVYDRRQIDARVTPLSPPGIRQREEGVLCLHMPL